MLSSLVCTRNTTIRVFYHCVFISHSIDMEKVNVLRFIVYRMYITRSAISTVILLFSVERSLSSLVEVNKTKVLILGAGLSGITTAKTLLNKNITDFLILEGKNYTGGRIHAVPFAGLNIEAGANWIQYTDDEDTAPFVKLRDEKKLNDIRSNYSDFVVR